MEFYLHSAMAWCLVKYHAQVSIIIIIIISSSSSSSSSYIFLFSNTCVDNKAYALSLS
jgi:hypothetical protein